MTSTAVTSIGDLDSPLGVLAYARSCQVKADQAQANLLNAAVVWAEQHPPESIDEAATWPATSSPSTSGPPTLRTPTRRNRAPGRVGRSRAR